MLFISNGEQTVTAVVNSVFADLFYGFVGLIMNQITIIHDFYFVYVITMLNSLRINLMQGEEETVENFFIETVD